MEEDLVQSTCAVHVDELRLSGILRQVWSARHRLAGLDHDHGPKEATHNHKMSLYYHMYPVYSMMA